MWLARLDSILVSSAGLDFSKSAIMNRNVRAHREWSLFFKVVGTVMRRSKLG